MHLSGKSAILTGAAGAIGRATTQALVSRGAYVHLLDHDQSGLDELAKAYAGSVDPVHIDLGDPAQIDGVISYIRERSQIEIVVNNAGILNNKKLAETSTQEMHRVQSVNLDAALQITRGFVPDMEQAGWGRVVNVSSYASKCGGLTAGTAYTISKTALIGLTFSTAREFAGKGITANAISPAYVMSPMVSEQLDAAQRKALLDLIPVGRFCTPQEVAHAILFLVSPLAGFITGEVLDMNGGLQFD